MVEPEIPADRLEQAAAKLWQHDHPEMSVFDCNQTMQETYRERVRIVAKALAPHKGEIQ